MRWFGKRIDYWANGLKLMVLRESAARMGTVVGLILFLVPGLTLSVPPGDLPICVALILIWGLVLVAATGWRRWLAIGMLVFCIVFAFKQVSDGKEFDRKHPGMRRSHSLFPGEQFH